MDNKLQSLFDKSNLLFMKTLRSNFFARKKLVNKKKTIFGNLNTSSISENINIPIH